MSCTFTFFIVFCVIVNDITDVYCFKGIMQSLDEGQSRLTAVSDLSKSALRTTTEDGCQIIDAELRQLNSDYSDLKLSTQAVKVNVERKLQGWVDSWKKIEDLSTWIRDAELKLGSVPEYGRDLGEKKLLLEQIKVL